MAASQSDATEHEFDVLMAKAGVEVPRELRAGAFACYQDLRRMSALINAPRSAADEPSNVFSLSNILRSA